MSEIRPLANGNVGSELDNDSNNFGDELAGNSAFIRALEVVVLRNIPQLLTPIFEPLVRRVVKEEIELAQQRFSRSTNQNSGVGEICPQLRKLKLRFRNKLSLPILTGKHILGEDDSPVKIDLIDENMGLVVKFGPEASAKVEVVALRVDSDDDEGHEWASEKFKQNIVTGSEKNKSLLIGKTILNLSEGTGSLDEISFTHGSSWTRKSEFMLGARFVNNYDGIAVTEAKSERFTLEDRRNKLYAKHHPPFLSDEVWRLENIRKGGRFHNRLDAENIKTVKDFLIQYFINCQKLQDIVQMPHKLFAATVEHGLKCKRDKHIYHPPNSLQNAGVIFDTVGQLLGVLLDNGFVSVDKLSEKAKDDAQILVASAFENWAEVIGYDENYIPTISTQEMPSPYSDTTQSVIASHTRPSTSPPSQTIFCKKPQISVVDDHMQPSTSSNLSENVLNKSHLGFVYDGMQPILSPSVGTPSPNNPIINSTTMTGDLGSLYDLQPADIEFLHNILRSPLHDPEPESQGFVDYANMFDDTSVVEDFDKKEQQSRIRKWLKMVLVVKFFLRMRTEKAEHIRKRTRFR